MRKLADNDAMEMCLSTHNGQPHLTLHSLLALDARGSLTVDLVKYWGAAVITGNAIEGHHNEQPHKRASRETIENLVFVAADTVQTIYEELARRHWSLPTPTYSEMIDGIEREKANG